MKRTACELCGAAAVVRCDPEDAFLCLACDGTVHGANFLVARHVRQAICSVCHRLDRDRPFSGAQIRLHRRTCCSSCDPDDADSSSSSSSCISTADGSETAAIPRRRRGREEKALPRWCRNMGMEDETAFGIATTALRVLRLCRERMGPFPFRICAAAAAWFAMKRRGFDRPGLLKRLEECSGAPSKRILAAESQLSLLLCGHQRESEDGWDSSSSSSSS